MTFQPNPRVDLSVVIVLLAIAVAAVFVASGFSFAALAAAFNGLGWLATLLLVTVHVVLMAVAAVMLTPMLLTAYSHASTPPIPMQRGMSRADYAKWPEARLWRHTRWYSALAALAGTAFALAAAWFALGVVVLGHGSATPLGNLVAMLGIALAAAAFGPVYDYGLRLCDARFTAKLQAA